MTRSQTSGAIDDFRSPGWRRLALVGLVLPLAAATVLVWATTGRPQNLDRIPVAIVNNDQIIQQPQPMAAGRALAAALTEPSSDQTNLDWTLANPDDAATGLEDGDYYAVLTIPKDFSKSDPLHRHRQPHAGKAQARQQRRLQRHGAVHQPSDRCAGRHLAGPAEHPGVPGPGV